MKTSPFLNDDAADDEVDEEELADLLNTPRAIVLADTDMDITPMIDITFLLLIFFLVASRIDANVTVKLPQARHGTTVTVNDSVVLTVVPAGDSVAVYMGEAIDPSAELAGDPATQNQLVEDYVQRELNADIPKKHVILRAAKEVKYREIARLLAAIGEVEGERIYVAVVEPNE